jgi:hypothetical protein
MAGEPGQRGALVGLLGLAGLAAAHFAWVKPTNFSGYDEWLLISLSSQGITSIPYAGRPLALLWTLPPAFVLPHRLWAYLAFHVAYIALAGYLTFALARRILPRQLLVAFLAGCFTVAWVPRDYLRLDAVLMIAGAGYTAATLTALLLFVEAWQRARWLPLALGMALGALILQGVEAVLPLLLGAPLLVLPVSGHQRRRWLGWSLAWASVPLLSGLLFLRRFLPGQGPSYQSSLGLDPHPVRVAGRLLSHYWMHLGPLVTTPPRDLLHPAVALNAVVLLAFFAVLAWRGGREADSPRTGDLPRGAVLGLMLAGLAWAAFAVSPTVRGPARTQVLPAPGIGLFLACAGGLAASRLRRRPAQALLAAGACLVVGLGTARTLKMQEEWEERSWWRAQSTSLRGLVAVMPDARPNTLVVLIDGAEVWPATFTFRHAVEYLYQRRAHGYVWGGNDYLYPASFTAGGIWSEPWAVIRQPWRSPPSLHRYDEVVVVRLEPEGTVSLVEEWPASLPPLPPGAAYAPRSRFVPASVPLPPQRILAVRDGVGGQ